MNSRIVVDPVTRIEGHLRIEAEVKDGKIVDAWSAGTMVRGLEIILKGRDPRDAWAFCERVCGVCTTVHALASVRAVEDAIGIAVPPDAELIRNIMFCTQYMQDHVVHFYHLHALDWVDVVSALKADPKATSELAQSISHWPKSSPGYFSDIQKRIGKFVESGQLGIFANGYWGHPAYKLPPEANLMGVAIGVAIAIATTRLIANQLFGVAPTDPVTLAAACALFLAVATMACLVPARRALRVDPTTALRSYS
jgi:hydrogenase large subunit